jgi:hypothetical protein
VKQDSGASQGKVILRAIVYSVFAAGGWALGDLSFGHEPLIPYGAVALIGGLGYYLGYMQGRTFDTQDAFQKQLNDMSERTRELLQNIDLSKIEKRDELLDVIALQAQAGVNWTELCAGPMSENQITEADVEAVIKRQRRETK